MFGTTIATRWFEQRRGVVLGIFAGGNATGALIFCRPSDRSSITSAGGRAPTFFRASRCAYPLILLVVRERPSDLGLPPTAPPRSTRRFPRV